MKQECAACDGTGRGFVGGRRGMCSGRGDMGWPGLIGAGIAIAIIVAMAVMYFTSDASAYARRPAKTMCASTAPELVWRLQAMNVSCATARAVERAGLRVNPGDTATIRAAGRTWWCNLASLRQHKDWYWFASSDGRRMVFVTTRYLVS